MEDQLAIKEIEARANDGDASAMYDFAVYQYTTANLRGEQRQEKFRAAEEWAKRAANAGHLLAPLLLGHIYSDKRVEFANCLVAKSYYQKALTIGNSDPTYPSEEVERCLAFVEDQIAQGL